MKCASRGLVFAMIVTTVGWMAMSTAVAGEAADAIKLYVATNGNDAWSGEMEAPNADGTDGPLATLTAARDKLRERPAKVPVTVLVRGGTYFLSEPFTLTPKDSGTEKAPVTYAAYRDEKPVISGGIRVTGWRRGSDGIWTAQLPAVGRGEVYPRQFFVNGERRTRARTPNDGYLRTDGPLPQFQNPHKERRNPKAKMGFSFKPGDIKRWKNLEDVNLFSYASWTAPLHWIKRIDMKNHTVHFTAPASWPLAWWERHQRYYVENCIEALDAPGEWYLNRKTGRLSYYPLEGEKITRAEAVMPALQQVVRIEGDLDAQTYVEYVTFRGLTFKDADWPENDRKSADGQAAAFLSGAFFMRGARHCTIAECEIANVGQYALDIQLGCTDNRVSRCHFHDMGAGGVRIGHMSKPNKKGYTTQRNTVDNCIIRDGGHVFRAGVGVIIFKSSYNTVSHNEICDFYYSGLSVGWSWGYAPSSAHHNTVEFNHVHHLGIGELSDMGGIYTLGRSPGTVIRNNIFHDIHSYAYGGWGLYTDEGSTGIVMENNIVYNTKTGGFHQHYGKDNIIRNNVLAFSLTHQLQRSRDEKHRSFVFERNIVIFDNGNLLGSRWGNNRYDMDYNVYWDTSGEEFTFAGDSLAEWRKRGHDKHSVIADPQFVDAKGHDFHLKPDSPALKLGFKPIDAEKAGIYGPKAWTDLAATFKHRKYAPPPPKGPEPIDDDFEDTAVGDRAKGCKTQEFNDNFTARVTDQTAASGKHSLKFIDGPGQEHAWTPHIYYHPNMKKGTATASFSLRMEAKARMNHEWRTQGHPYRVGPTMRIEADGRLFASGKHIISVPRGEWFGIEISCALGKKATGTYDMTVTLPGKKPKTFKNIPCRYKKFRELMWLGFVSDSRGKAVYYLDELKLDTTEK